MFQGKLTMLPILLCWLFNLSPPAMLKCGRTAMHINLNVSIHLFALTYQIPQQRLKALDSQKTRIFMKYFIVLNMTIFQFCINFLTLLVCLLMQIQTNDTYKDCDPQCLGGCSGSGPKNCHACRNYLTHEGECVSSCPDKT